MKTCQTSSAAWWALALGGCLGLVACVGSTPARESEPVIASAASTEAAPTAIHSTEPTPAKPVAAATGQEAEPPAPVASEPPKVADSSKVAASFKALTDSPIAIEPVFLETQWGPIRGFIATVDLTDPRVEVVVSDGAAGELDNPEAEVVLTPANDFVAQSKCALAVNANFFRWLENAAGEKTIADIVGLSVTDGVAVSVANAYEGKGDPAIVFNKKGLARVLEMSPSQVEASGDVWDGVAGIGGSAKDATPGTLLVIDGVNHGGTARPGPEVRHPRTAAGVDRDGNTLILAVIDGRQIGHSIGITLVELAALMIDAGADDAVNLDGGGSTSILCHVGATSEPTVTAALDADGDGWITNQPSDGRYRPVANHLGIRLREWTLPSLPGLAPAVSATPHEETP